MGRLEIKTIKSPELNLEKTIRIYLPTEYDLNPNKKYPVIYMHDGQNLFNKEDSAYGFIWDVHSTLDKLQEEKHIDGLIVVGIDNNTTPGARLDEYSPWQSDIKFSMKYDNLGTKGGKGSEYGEFIVNTLKPYIDSNYRTLKDRENTLLAGSSMGGFISIYMGLKYQDTFSKIGAFSTASWFAEDALLSYIKETNIRRHMKFYFDIGTNETSDPTVIDFPKYYLDGTRKIVELFKEKNFNDSNLKYIIEENAVHNEDAWKKRFPTFLNWIL